MQRIFQIDGEETECWLSHDGSSMTLNTPDVQFPASWTRQKHLAVIHCGFGGTRKICGWPLGPTQHSCI